MSNWAHQSVTKLDEVFFCHKIELIEFTDSWLNPTSFFSQRFHTQINTSYA